MDEFEDHLDRICGSSHSKGRAKHAALQFSLSVFAFQSLLPRRTLLAFMPVLFYSFTYLGKRPIVQGGGGWVGGNFAPS